MKRRTLIQAAVLTPAAALLPDKFVVPTQLPPMRIIVFEDHLSAESLARLQEFIRSLERAADYNRVLLFDDPNFTPGGHVDCKLRCMDLFESVNRVEQHEPA